VASGGMKELRAGNVVMSYDTCVSTAGLETSSTSGSHMSQSTVDEPVTCDRST